MNAGVVAIQGDFEKHVLAFRDLGVDTTQVRLPEHLDGITHLVIPGGESTTVGLLMQRYGLGEAIKQKAQEGLPIWGTCMGMIMMAKTVRGRPGQYTLDLLDIEVERNAFGAQIHSFEDLVQMEGLKEDVLGVFIRAPVVTTYGDGVKPIGTYKNRVVAVRQGNLFGTSFHPELTEDRRMHSFFLKFQGPVDSPR